ncbi:MAG: biopolymer transporter ExbD [Woeseiaceae bacterium]|nr:biopolymer transporter ExbD [Woeseiaceae bacterium]
MRRHHHHDDEAEINITPMLDIVFIMLIFFIVTTSFIKESGIDMSRPSNEPPKTEKIADVIFVKIDAVGQIYVRERLTDIRAVRANIESGLALKPDASVVIAASRESDAGILVRVVDQARVAGAERVSVVALAEQ